MKKFAIAAASLFVLSGVAACGGNADGGMTTNNTPTTN